MPPRKLWGWKWISPAQTWGPCIFLKNGWLTFQCGSMASPSHRLNTSRCIRGRREWSEPPTRCQVSMPTRIPTLWYILTTLSCIKLHTNKGIFGIFAKGSIPEWGKQSRPVQLQPSQGSFLPPHSTVGYRTAQLFKISHQFAGRLLRTGVLITRLQMDNCRV